AQGNEDRSSLINHAQYEVARMYEHGIGVPQNKKLARQIYLQIAEYSGAARYKVATMYEQGDGVPKDLKKAAEYYANAYSSGWVKGTGSRVVAQIGLYAIDPAACKDPVDFAQQLRAEESGVTLPQTQRQLGQIYYDGKPLAQDFAKASEWFTKAALQNDPIAQYRLGQMWASGTHGPPNMEEAVLWYLKAARQGLADAQYKLGSAYFEGSGVSKDLIAAFVWLSAAAQNGFANAEELLADLRATMSAEEVEKAKQHPFLRNVK
ncbi:MAG: tetratricopeptide repeat protein, partial [Limisphaerales bacterium]